MRIILTYILSCTVSKLLQIIGQILAVDGGGGCLFSTHSFSLNPKLSTTKVDVSKLETSLYCMVWKVFRYLEPFRRDSRVWQTDGRTDEDISSQQIPHFPTLRGQKCTVKSLFACLTSGNWPVFYCSSNVHVGMRLLWNTVFANPIFLI